MKPLPLITSLIFFSLLLIFTLSHADLHLDHDHHESSYSPDRAAEDNTPRTQSSAKLLPAASAGITEVDLSHFVNRNPVRLTNRFPFPRVLRFFPHRYHHHHHHLVPNPDRQSGKWGPGEHEIEQDDVVQFMFMKKNGLEIDRVLPAGNRPYSDQILQHRHVARSEPDHQEADPIIFGEFKRPHYLIPARHRSRHHHDHDHDDDDHDHDEDWKSVVFKKERKDKHRHHEDQRQKEGNKREKNPKENGHHDHHDHDHHDHHDHHGHEDHEEREEGVMNKIRKFLAYF